MVKEVTEPGLVHPALIPGIGVERTGRVFHTNPVVFAVAGLAVVGVILWAALAPDNVSTVGSVSLAWVTKNFGWMFGVVAIAIALFMLVLGYGRTGGVRLLFYGPYEALTYFLDPPHGFNVEPGTVDAMQAALVGSDRLVVLRARRRSDRLQRLPAGPLTADLGDLRADLRLSHERTARRGHRHLRDHHHPLRHCGLAGYRLAADRQWCPGGHRDRPAGERLPRRLDGAAHRDVHHLGGLRGQARDPGAVDINMVAAGLLALFVFVAGPTVYLLNFLLAAALDFFSELGPMLIRNPNQGADTAEFMAGWTTFYWAWWVSWTPFVGLFIAKISRGRTLREFVTVVILVPSAVCLLWFGVFGGTSIWMELNGQGMSESDSPEALLFDLLENLPFGAVTSVVAMISIVIFFVTSADSASIVMSSMSQSGKPEPSRWVTIVWGAMLGTTAAALLLAGGQDALSGLQSIMVVSALPFAFVVMGIMGAWANDLRTDPYMLRNKYARAAIAEGVRLGIADHGDDFVFGSSEVGFNEGAGAWLDSTDPELSAWYLAATGELREVDAEDVRRTLEPGRIQPRGPERPDLTASGDASLATGRARHRRNVPPDR